MSRARDLSKLGNPNVIKADATSVGFGTQVAGNPANAASSLISAGIVTATAFYGDGSNLEGVASAGLGTAVDDTKDSIGQNIYYTNQELSIYENTTVNAPATSDVAYTQYSQVTVEPGKELIIADGDTFIPDVLGIGTGLQAVAAGAGNGVFGTVYTDSIENAAGRGGPNFPLGATVVGVLTASTGSFSGNVSIGGTLTYEDVTNIDSVGVITARSGIVATGVVTATSFKGDGSTLTGMASTDKVSTATLNVSGISTFSGTQVSAITAMGANSVNCSLGNFFTKTITGATTLTFDSVPTGVEYSFTLEVTLNGSNAITWPASVKWNADTAPTITDGKTQLFMFLTTNGGTRWRGSALVDYVN